MASFIIHIAVAQELNKRLKRDNRKLLIGSIAPDIAKFIGQTKSVTHFQKTIDDLPNLDKFLSKYKEYLVDDFVLGYYIHLYTDYLWFKEIEPSIYHNSVLYKLDNTTEVISNKDRLVYFYHDYDLLNKKLIELYDIKLDFLSKDIPELKNIIKEYSYDKTSVIIKKASDIIAKDNVGEFYVFDEKIVGDFISRAIDIIYDELERIL